LPLSGNSPFLLAAIKSYDGELPRLHGAVCDDRAEAISRRHADGEALA
jgi:hypothetical protein